MQHLRPAGVRGVRPARPNRRCDLHTDTPKSQGAEQIMSDASSSILHRTVRARVLTSLVGCSAAVSLLAAPAAGADDSFSAYALNGRFLVTSNGDWAKTNDVYHNQQTVRQVWTMTSSCVDTDTCSGKVVSSQGWSADLTYTSQWWTVRHVVDNWQPCRDGTAAAGTQTYRFWGEDPDGNGLAVHTDATLLGGTDKTLGNSGDCGISRQLEIYLPLRLQKLD
jgi:hypothetical protein